MNLSRQTRILRMSVFRTLENSPCTEILQEFLSFSTCSLWKSKAAEGSREREIGVHENYLLLRPIGTTAARLLHTLSHSLNILFSLSLHNSCNSKGCVSLLGFFQASVLLYLEQIHPIPLLEGHIAWHNCREMLISGLSSDDGEEKNSYTVNPWLTPGPFLFHGSSESCI